MTHSQTQSDLAERLLEAETIDSALRAEYERKLSAMFEYELPRWKKLFLITVTIAAILLGGTTLLLALTEPLRASVRTIFLCLTGFAATWAFYCIRVMWRGIYRARIDAPVAAGMAFSYSIMLCVLLLADGRLGAENVLLVGATTLLPSSLLMVHSLVKQSEMRVQEQLVRLEYKLAKLNQKLGDDDDESSGAGVLR
jgi:hypothetical protein